MEQVVPRLRSAIPVVCHCVYPEDQAELVQDSIAMACKLMHNVESKGKQVTPGNIAYYTIQHIKSGRRSTGSSVVDVHASQTQLNGTTRISSLDEVVASNEECGGEIFTFNDVLSNDQEDPGTKAARKMDWESLLASLSLRDRAIIQFMIEGKSGSAMARKLKVCPSTISNRKRDLAVKIQDFMGYKILVDIQRQPKWRNDLAANRERLACRHERNH
jgi:hypothetical protein